MNTVGNQTSFNIFFTTLIPIQRLKLSDKEAQNLPDAPGGERTATMLMSEAAKKPTNIEQKKSESTSCVHVVFFDLLGEGGLFLTSICHEKNHSPPPTFHIFVSKKKPGRGKKNSSGRSVKDFSEILSLG